MSYNFVVHSNEMECRKRVRLGLDPVNGGLLIYLHGLIYGPNWGFFAFGFNRICTDPVKCLVEEGGSKSVSSDQGIPHWQ